MTPAIPAIQTRYAGYHFRSRLEARWAVFFDAVGVPWEYEKEGFELNDEINGVTGRYLPDFWLPKQQTWLEIKPCLPDPHWVTTDVEQLMWALVHHTGARHGYVFFGLPDHETFCSWIYNPGRHDGGYIPPNDPNRSGMNIHDLLGVSISLKQQHFDAAKSARFEFGAKGK